SSRSTPCTSRSSGARSYARVRPCSCTRVPAGVGAPPSPPAAAPGAAAGPPALQLGVAAGARVLATAGSPEKVAFCKELGADVAIDYRKEDFVARVLDATGGRGVDVVCDTVGAPVAIPSWRCVAHEGRYLVAGFSSGIEAGEAGLP